MFIGPLLIGSFLGYVAAGVVLLLGLAVWSALLTLIGTGVSGTGLLLMLLAWRDPLALRPRTTPARLHTAL